jgi:type IV secretory pathway VirB2 component (pilin)
MRALWRRWFRADRVSAVSATGVFLCTLLPWVSSKSRLFVLGIETVGALYAALAVAALWLLFQRARDEMRAPRASPRRRTADARRVSLVHLLLGGASTALGIYFLIVFGLEKRFGPAGFELRYGFYLALVAGIGLSYGGYARFMDGRHLDGRQMDGRHMDGRHGE